MWKQQNMMSQQTERFFRPAPAITFVPSVAPRAGRAGRVARGGRAEFRSFAAPRKTIGSIDRKKKIAMNRGSKHHGLAADEEGPRVFVSGKARSVIEAAFSSLLGHDDDEMEKASSEQQLPSKTMIDEEAERRPARF